MLILGAHMSISEGFAAAAEKAGKDYRCNAMQMFTKSPRGGRKVKSIDKKDALDFRKNVKKYGIKFVVVHSSYLLNFGKTFEQTPWALDDILLDFERLDQLGGDGVIVHTGKLSGQEENITIKNIIENAKKIVNFTESTGLKYIIENTAGAGGETGYTLEQMRQIWKGLEGHNPRLKMCLDIAHLWGAGYDLSTPNLVQQFFKDYSEAVGVKNLACIHFNDAKTDLGSHVDRHNNIGEGKIGLPGLKAIAEFAVKNSIPLILETPEKEGKTRVEDVKKIKAFF